MAKMSDILTRSDQSHDSGTIARRSFLWMLAAAASIRKLIPNEALAAASWPRDPITIVVTTKAGGGFDHMARNLAPALSQELGVPVDVLDSPGGAMVIGTDYFLSRPHNGNTLLISGPSPFWFVDINKFHATFKLSDFEILNIQWSDKSAVFVPHDGKLQSFKQIVDSIKSHPGKFSCGVVRDSGEFFNTGILLETLKVPFSAVRLVTYGASAPLRTAIAGGQLDFAIVSLESSISMFSLMKPVAVFNDERLPIIPDVPTVNAVLKPYGITVNFVPSSLRCVITYGDLKKTYPDQYEKLYNSYKKVLQNPEFIAKAKKEGIGSQWLGPKKSLLEIASAFAILDKYKGLLTKLG